MGVLNVTPDSFSDGGLYESKEAAVRHVAEMVVAGADIIDIGGESTRPGAKEVSLQEELDRTIPIVEEVASRFSVRLSIDTRKSEVAKCAIAAGATIINDTSGGSDPAMAALAAKDGLTIILMHMQGTPETMQREPSYPRGVVTEVSEFLEGRVKAFEEAGVPWENIWVDPGIGFGKLFQHNLDLLRQLDDFASIGGRLVIGTSRKAFLGTLVGETSGTPEAVRDPGTLATNLWAYTKGASVFRVHDVLAMRRALSTWEALSEGDFRC